jgi:hypothetical protein
MVACRIMLHIIRWLSINRRTQAFVDSGQLKITHQWPRLGQRACRTPPKNPKTLTRSGNGLAGSGSDRFANALTRAEGGNMRSSQRYCSTPWRSPLTFAVALLALTVAASLSLSSCTQFQAISYPDATNIVFIDNTNPNNNAAQTRQQRNNAAPLPLPHVRPGSVAPLIRPPDAKPEMIVPPYDRSQKLEQPQKQEKPQAADGVLELSNMAQAPFSSVGRLTFNLPGDPPISVLEFAPAATRAFRSRMAFARSTGEGYVSRCPSANANPGASYESDCDLLRMRRALSFVSNLAPR